MARVTFRSWGDVLVEPEEVSRVVAGLDSPEPVPGRARVGCAHPLLALISQEVDVHAIVALVSVVAQSTYLFNTSIRENLLVARRDATEETLIRAGKQAHLDSFIESLPRGGILLLASKG